MLVTVPRPTTSLLSKVVSLTSFYGKTLHLKLLEEYRTFKLTEEHLIFYTDERISQFLHQVSPSSYIKTIPLYILMENYPTLYTDG